MHIHIFLKANARTHTQRQTERRLQNRITVSSLFHPFDTHIVCCILIAIWHCIESGLAGYSTFVFTNTSFLYPSALSLHSPHDRCTIGFRKRYVCFHHYNTFGMCCDSSNTNLSITIFKSAIFFTPFASLAALLSIFVQIFYKFIMLLSNDEAKKNTAIESELCILAKNARIIQFQLFIMNTLFFALLYQTPFRVSSTIQNKRNRERKKMACFWLNLSL